MNHNGGQFPESLKGFKNRGVELPDAKGFSEAALAGHKKKKVSQNVSIIEPRGGVISALSKEEYNRASADLTNMRKSGEAAKYDASIAERRNKTGFSELSKREKKTIKIDSSK